MLCHRLTSIEAAGDLKTKTNGGNIEKIYNKTPEHIRCNYVGVADCFMGLKMIHDKV